MLIINIAVRVINTLSFLIHASCYTQPTPFGIHCVNILLRFLFSFSINRLLNAVYLFINKTLWHLLSCYRFQVPLRATRNKRIVLLRDWMKSSLERGWRILTMSRRIKLYKSSTMSLDAWTVWKRRTELSVPWRMS